MARMTAIHQLGLHLSADEVHALYWLLRQKYLSQGDLSQESFAALKNDVLDALIRQQPVPPDLGQEIVGMYRDHATDPLWRDYCVQHFAMYYGRMWSKSDMEGGTSPAPAAATSSSAAASRFPDDPDRNDILSAFDEALLEKDNGIAGTALLGLYSLASGGYAEVAATAIGDKALAMALDETCAVPTRITAIGICGLTGKAEVLPVARILAQTSDVLPLRLSSIATIGALGATQDLELLEGLRAGKDERLYKAINGSLKKLRQRGIAGP